MSNFHPKLQDATEEELLYMINELDFRVVPLASDELTRRYLSKLQRVIETSAEAEINQSNRLVETMKKADESAERYNRALFYLSSLMFIAALAQLFLASATIPGVSLWARVFGSLILAALFVLAARWMAKELDMDKP